MVLVVVKTRDEVPEEHTTTRTTADSFTNTSASAWLYDSPTASKNYSLGKESMHVFFTVKKKGPRNHKLRYNVH